MTGSRKVAACTTFTAMALLGKQLTGSTTESFVGTPRGASLNQQRDVDFTQVRGRRASTNHGAHSYSMAGSGAIATTAMLSCGLAAHRRAAARRSTALKARGGAAKDTTSVEDLLTANRAQIDEIKAACGDSTQDKDDIWFLRFALQHPGDTKAAVQNVREVLKWRETAGKQIVEAAAKAVAEATKDGGWDNSVVIAAAPNVDRVGKYLTPSAIIVLSTLEGDLVSCIRAAAIDSPKMMSEVTEEELVDFFIYAREVNFTVAEARTRKTGRFTKLIAANDLTGVSSFPDQKFQNALTEASKKAVTLYPGLAGPTVLLNLPWLARALVGLLVPLFPGAVRDKLKFARTPMNYMNELTDVLKEPTKGQFLSDFQAVLNS